MLFGRKEKGTAFFGEIYVFLSGLSHEAGCQSIDVGGSLALLKSVKQCDLIQAVQREKRAQFEAFFTLASAREWAEMLVLV